MSVRIPPSILAADFAALGASIAAAERGGADLVHVDGMGGHFVPNLTVGPPVVRSIKRVARVPLDVHLMIEDPDRYIPAFVEAGAALVSVHVEVLPHLHRTLGLIKSLGAQGGVVLNPSTPVGCLEEVAPDVDFVLESGPTPWGMPPLADLRALRLAPRPCARAMRLAGAARRARALVPPDTERLHAHFANDAAALARYLATVTGLPYDVTAHAYDLYRDPFLLGPNLRFASRIFTVARSNLAWLRERAASLTNPTPSAQTT